MSIVLDNRPIQLDTIRLILESSPPQVELDERALARLDQSREVFIVIARSRRVYGVNTGFGPMATVSFEERDWGALQVNLIRSHAMGLGAPLDASCVRAILLARIASLLRGYSAVGREPVVLLTKMLTGDCLPVIPEHGGVGASGDLVQLAHVALCAIGEGEVHLEGRLTPTQDAFRALGLTPLKPAFREGLALINGTAAMTGIGLETLLRARRLVDWSIALSSLQQEIMGSTPEAFSSELNAVKQHPGQSAVAAHMRDWLEGSRALRSTAQETAGRPLQAYYSLRCVPQILGPIFDCLANVQDVLLGELNSVSDNPIFDSETGQIFHGGNFHGEYVAVAMDHLKIAIAKLSMLCDRQLNALLNDRINEILPAFLSEGRPGLDMGLQGAQFTATSTAAENQTLAYPMSLHSIPSNKDNQDVVSMGANAALMARRTALNACDVLAVLGLAVVRAVSLLKIHETLAPRTLALWNQLRAAESLAAMRSCLESSNPKA